jgi:hypothetical protein
MRPRYTNNHRDRHTTLPLAISHCQRLKFLSSGVLRNIDGFDGITWSSWA